MSRDRRPGAGASILACAEWLEYCLLAAGLAFGHGADNAFDEAVWLVLAGAGLDIGAFDDDWDRPLADAQIDAIQALAARRIASRKPLAYLLNEAWFAGLPYYVDERVIVPRSHLGSWIADRFAPWIDPRPVARALDLCCGSGCIAVALAGAFPAARIDAADLSAAALEVAAINVERHQAGERIRLVQSDLWQALTDQRYDLIVSNPPYVGAATMAGLPAEYRHEPAMAFVAGADGLDAIIGILAGARVHLTDRGSLIVEAGSAAAALEAYYPAVAFNWLLAADGEPVMFALSAGELDRYGPVFGAGVQG